MADVSAVLSRRVDSRDTGFVAGLRYAPFRKVVAISENIKGSAAGLPLVAFDVAGAREVVV